MKKVMRNPIVLIALALLACDIVLHLTMSSAPLGPDPMAQPVQTVPSSLGGILGGVMILGVIYVFFHGMTLAFRGHRSFHARIKRDGIWKRPQ